MQNNLVRSAWFLLYACYSDESPLRTLILVGLASSLLIASAEKPLMTRVSLVNSRVLLFIPKAHSESELTRRSLTSPALEFSIRLHYFLSLQIGYREEKLLFAVLFPPIFLRSHPLNEGYFGEHKRPERRIFSAFHSSWNLLQIP